MWYLLLVLNLGGGYKIGGGVSSELIPVGSKAECEDRMKSLDKSAIDFQENRDVEVRALCVKGAKN